MPLVVAYGPVLRGGVRVTVVLSSRVGQTPLAVTTETYVEVALLFQVTAYATAVTVDRHADEAAVSQEVVEQVRVPLLQAS